jgi:hypothetical protein
MAVLFDERNNAISAGTPLFPCLRLLMITGVSARKRTVQDAETFEQKLRLLKAA